MLEKEARNAKSRARAHRLLDQSESHFLLAWHRNKEGEIIWKVSVCASCVEEGFVLGRYMATDQDNIFRTAVLPRAQWMAFADIGNFKEMEACMV